MEKPLNDMEDLGRHGGIKITCKTSEEVIKSPIFASLFKECLGKLPHINADYFYKIYQDLVELNDTSIADAKKLYDLLESKEFIDVYTNFYNNLDINLNISLSDISNLNLLSLENIVNALKKLISLNAIYLNQNKILQRVKKTLDNGTDLDTNFPPINLHLNIDEVIFGNHIDGKGYVLLNGNGEQKSPEGEFYKEIDFRNYDKTGLIIAKKTEGCVLLNGNGEQVSQNGEFYKTINFEYYNKTGLIIAQRSKGGVLLNGNGEQVSQEGEFYDHFVFGDKFIKTVKNEGYVLLNLSGIQLSPEGIFYKKIIIDHYKVTGLFIAIDNEKYNIVLDINGREILKTKNKVHFDEKECKLYYRNPFKKLYIES